MQFAGSLASKSLDEGRRWSDHVFAATRGTFTADASCVKNGAPVYELGDDDLVLWRHCHEAGSGGQEARCTWWVSKRKQMCDDKARLHVQLGCMYVESRALRADLIAGCWNALTHASGQQTLFVTIPELSFR